MNKRHVTSALTAAALAGTTLAAATGPTQGATEQQAAGTRSLAKVLAADGHHFDNNWRDFDIVDYLIGRVLEKKPDSDVGIVAMGRKRVTAFLPADYAWRKTAREIVGRDFKSERRVARAMWRAAENVGVVEQHLLYHLVPDATITYREARLAAPTRLTTLEGGQLKVRYRHGRVVLVDFDEDSPNARAYRPLSNINKGNRQIAHGISWMLSPFGS